MGAPDPGSATAMDSKGVQLIHQIEQKAHLVDIREPVTG
jgi:hypothetical protein